MSTEKKTAGTAVEKAAAPAPSALTGTAPTELFGTFEQDAGAGMERVTRDDVVIPFLMVLQDLSPQVKKTEEQYVEGAEVGQFFLTLPRTVFTDTTAGVNVIPVYFDKRWNLWKDRKLGGGFRGSYASKAEAEAARIERATEEEISIDKLDVIETAQHFVLVQMPDTGIWKPAVFNCKSTFLGRSREWVAMMQELQLPTSDGSGRSFTPPSYAAVYNLHTVIKRDQSNSWYVFRAERTRFVSALELEMARSFYELVSTGAVQVDYNVEARETASSSADAAPTDPNRPAF